MFLLKITETRQRKFLLSVKTDCANRAVEREFKMLLVYEKRYLIKILTVLEKIWGDDWAIIKIDIKNAPFALMDIEVQIYKKYRILLAYDRSLLGIFIMRNGEPVHISKFTKQELITGFEVCK